MRTVLERARARLVAHVEQRRDLALLVAASDTDAAVLMKIVQALDDERASELFWIQSAAFRGAESWIDAVVDEYLALNTAAAALAASKGERQPPDAPKELTDRTLPPARRLRELMMHSRSIAPDPEGLTVWGLLPLEIHDPRGWSELIDTALRFELPYPWCERIRVVVREDSRAGFGMGPELDRRGIARTRVDFSTPALEASLVEDARDTKRPLEERMQALLMSASSDYAHGRADDALQKYGVLLRHYEGLGNDAMCAIVLNGIGEVHLRRGEPRPAEAHFVTAMKAGASGKTPAVSVVLNAALNLANLCRSEQRWVEAAANYRAVETLSGLTHSDVTAVQAAEARAFCENAAGDPITAADTWLDAGELALAFRRDDLRAGVVARLRKHLDANAPALADPARRGRWQALESAKDGGGA